MCLIVSDVLVFYNNSGLGQEAFLFKLAEKSQEFRSLEDKWFYDTVNCFLLDKPFICLIIDALQKKTSFLIP